MINLDQNIKISDEKRSLSNSRERSLVDDLNEKLIQNQKFKRNVVYNQNKSFSDSSESSYSPETPKEILDKTNNDDSDVAKVGLYTNFNNIRFKEITQNCNLNG